MTTLVPDLRPHEPPPPPGSECCDCCEGIGAETPQALGSRFGLSAVPYRIGDQARFRASLHAALSSSASAPLAALLTRDDDDFAIGLIDAFACAADVLTFYQERIANESWLRTATQRVSLQEMGKLVGYRLRPGVAAETWLAFAIETPPTPPPSLPPEPGNFITGVPESVRLEIGTRVQSMPGPGELPQTFELVEPLAETRPAWNAIRPWLTERHLPAAGESEAWLAGTATGLRPGDALLLVGDEYFADATSDNWDFRLLSTVEPDAAGDRTRVAWVRGLGSSHPHSAPAAQPHVFALRVRTAVFGNTAPVWRSMNATFRSDYAAKFGGSADAGEWPAFAISEIAADDTTGGAVDLDQLRADIAADVTGDPATRSFAVLAKGDFNRPDEGVATDTYVELFGVTSTTEISRAAFATSSKITRLTLKGEGLQTHFASKVRETGVFARSQRLPLAERPVTSPIVGDRIPIALPATGLLPGRRLIVRGIRASDGGAVAVQALLVAAHAIDAGHAELEIAPPLVDPLVRASLVVHANVAAASHGEGVTQVLGSGSAALPFQRFDLKQAPLTYRAAASADGIAAELTVRIGDVAWRERPTLFGAQPGDRVYALATDEQGRVSIVFGDGVRGARLPSGTNNVRAFYRKGIGAAGNVAGERLTQLVSRPLGLKSVSNPLAAQGGTDPEPADAARTTIPLTTRTLGRAVSLLDYEDFARAFAGVAKAQAAVLQPRAGTTIAITLAAAAGTPIGPASPIWQNLLAAFAANGDPHVAVALLPLRLSTFHVGLRIKRDPAYAAATVLAAVEAALRARFAFVAREIGAPVQQSDVIAAAQGVPGVIAVDLTRLYGGTQPAQQAVPSLQMRLRAQRMHVVGGVAQPAELLVLDPAPFDELGEMG